MKKCIEKRREINRFAFILLSGFFFLRALLLSPDEKMKIQIDPLSFTGTTVNVCYILLIAVFSVLFSFVVLKNYRCHDSLTAIPVILLAADPLLPYIFQNCIQLILGSLLLLCIIFFANKSIIKKTIIAAGFSALSALLSPMSLFVCFPIMLIMFFFNKGKKAILPVCISAVTFAAFSVVYEKLYEQFFNFRDFISLYSFSEDRDFSKTIEYLNVTYPISQITSVLIMFIVYLLIMKIKTASKLKDKKILADEILNSFVAVIAFALTAVGVFAYGIMSCAFTLVFVTFVVLIRDNDCTGLRIAERIRSFTDRHFFVLVIILAVLSAIMVNLKPLNRLYTLATIYLS